MITETGLNPVWRAWFDQIKQSVGQALGIPTGTGFRHVTGGLEDATAKLVENADVKSTAAIVESKLAFNPTTGHDHDGADSKKVDHGNLNGLLDDDHTQYAILAGRGVVGIPIYANNAAAIAGGLGVGAFYRTGVDPDFVCVVH